MQSSTTDSAVRISLTEFLDFLMTSGPPKITAARNAKIRRLREYNPQTDFHKPFRECVTGPHFGITPELALDSLIQGLQDAKKLANYPEMTQGIKAFLKGRDVSWFVPPRADWSGGGITVRVNPEWGVVIDGSRHVVKMYLKKGKMTKEKVMLINHLMDSTLTPQGGAATFGVLNVRKSKLYTQQSQSASMTSLLEGEAATFARIYRES